MPTEVVSLRWVHDRVFLLQDRFGFPIVMTQPMGVNGADLLPLSVAGCAAWDVVEILQKQHQQVTGLRVTAKSQREDQAPWRFQAIRLFYSFTGINLAEDRVRRAIELTETKYCSTLLTLRGSISIQSQFEICDLAGLASAPSADWKAATPTGEEPQPALPAEPRASAADVVQLILDFNAALNRGDVAGMLKLMTDDCIYENTYPPPAGERYSGQAAVRGFWEGFFRDSLEPRIETEEIFALGERCVMCWTYHWLDNDGKPGHVRGVDVYSVRAGLIAEKRSYVKG